MDLIERRNAMGWAHIAPLPDPFDQPREGLPSAIAAPIQASPAKLLAPPFSKGQSRRSTAI
jgi:hypothetical protein